MTVDDFGEIKKPGTLFKWGDTEFMSDGMGRDELNIVRLSNYGDRGKLPITELEDGIENDEVVLLDTTAL